MIAIDVDFIEKLGRWCSPNLRSLSITLYYRDLFSKVHKFKNLVVGSGSSTGKATSTGFLSKLESLTIDGDVSLCLIESLLTSVSRSLKSLTIYIHRQVIYDSICVLHFRCYLNNIKTYTKQDYFNLFKS